MGDGTGREAFAASSSSRPPASWGAEALGGVNPGCFGPGSPSHAVKKGRRYRYYVSRHLITEGKKANRTGWRIPAADLEALVVSPSQRKASPRGTWSSNSW